MRLVFMGTPAFVVPVLDTLHSASDVEIVGTYTAPDRPGGRGRAPQSSPVKQRALELELPIFQPSSLRRTNVQQELADLKPQVIVVAAYGRFLPAEVLTIPEKGCLNLHPSLLPKYRGPSPVVSSILEGDTLTGVTLMLLDEGMDTGPIIAQVQRPISPDDTAESLTNALFQMGASLLLNSLDPWMAGKLPATPQDDTLATITKKFEREDGRADWSLSAHQLALKCRAFTPWPGLYTQWEGSILKLLEVVVLPEYEPNSIQPGEVIALDNMDSPLGIGTAAGILGIRRIQLEGRRPASAAEFLRGYSRFIGSKL